MYIFSFLVLLQHKRGCVGERMAVDGGGKGGGKRELEDEDVIWKVRVR